MGTELQSLVVTCKLQPHVAAVLRVLRDAIQDALGPLVTVTTSDALRYAICRVSEIDLGGSIEDISNVRSAISVNEAYRRGETSCHRERVVQWERHGIDGIKRPVIQDEWPEEGSIDGGGEGSEEAEQQAAVSDAADGRGSVGQTD